MEKEENEEDNEEGKRKKRMMKDIHERASGNRKPLTVYNEATCSDDLARNIYHKFAKERKRNRRKRGRKKWKGSRNITPDSKITGTRGTRAKSLPTDYQKARQR